MSIGKFLKNLGATNFSKVLDVNNSNFRNLDLNIDKSSEISIQIQLVMGKMIQQFIHMFKAYSFVYVK